MTAEATALAGASLTSQWHAIDWQVAQRHVRRLQMRIAKATRPGGRVIRRWPLPWLERCVWKQARTVLRGLGGGNPARLPGSFITPPDVACTPSSNASIEDKVLCWIFF